jgi:hypothetical protein
MERRSALSPTFSLIGIIVKNCSAATNPKIFS